MLPWECALFRKIWPDGDSRIMDKHFIWYMSTQGA